MLGGGGAGGAMVGGASGGNDAGGAGGLGACSDVLAPTLQTFSIEVAPNDWTNIQAEFASAGVLTPDQFFQHQEVLYPIVFHYGSETVSSNVFIHLKGQSSWLETVQMDGPTNGKMQFVIVFDSVDSNAAFHGLGKIGFDMPRTDLTFLHERLANSWLRLGAGLPGLCATSARLEINGSYYGLYAAEEHLGHRFLTQFFPATNGNGDLIKGGTMAETNQSSLNLAKLNQFWAVTDAASLQAVVDVPSSVQDWAAEAMMNDGDGYWGGWHNFYIYDQGAKGYAWISTDLDSTFDYLGEFTDDPITWWSTRVPPPLEVQPHYRVVMGDDNLRASYIDALANQLGKWDVAKLQGWIDSWSAQIRDAVAADPHKPATTDMSAFDAAVALARSGVQQRADFVRRWIDCRHSGSGEDKDGDGFIWCQDCRDDDSSIHPGAHEVCGNGIDENCNGLFDEGCPASTARDAAASD
jgi:hypothetical protein